MQEQTSFIQGLHPRRLRKRLGAWMNAQNGGSFEPYIAGRKRALFGNLHGNLLELGPGSGPNLRYFAADVQWTGLEPNPYSHAYLQRSIRALGLPEQRSASRSVTQTVAACP